MPVIELPEIPRANTRPSTGSSARGPSSFKLPPASETESQSNETETESVLQAHYLRVQQSLMSAVDKQVMGIQKQVAEKDRLLDKALHEKEGLGVELYGTKRQLGRLNNNLAKVTQVLTQTKSSEKQANVEADAMYKELCTLKKENDDLRRVQREQQGKLDQSEQKIRQLTDLNLAFNNDIKIQSKIQHKLRRDLETSENIRKDCEARDETEKRRTETVLDEKKEVEGLLRDQKLETLRSQNAVDALNKEINSLTEINKSYKKKWEDSLLAMEKRDGSLHTVQQKQSSLDSKVVNLERRLAASDTEKKELELQLANYKQGNIKARLITTWIENESFRAQLGNLRLANQDLESRLNAVNGSRSDSAIENTYLQELEKIEKHHELAKQELHRKNLIVSELKNKLDRVKEDFNSNAKVEAIEKFAKTHDSIEVAAERRVLKAEQEAARDNYQLRHKNAELNAKLHEMEGRIAVFDSSYNTLKSQYDKVHEHYVKLYNDAKHIVYTLERKEHDVNYLKSVINGSEESDQTRKLKMNISLLQKELASSDTANHRLQTMWTDSQKEIFKIKQQLIDSGTDKSILSSKMGINEIVKGKAMEQLEESKKEGMEVKLENNKLVKESRKLRQQVDDLRHKNTNTHMLKTEIRRLHQDRQAVVRSRLQDDKSSSVLERKYILVKEALDKLKTERQEIKLSNFELKCRAEDMEKRYNDLKNQYQHFAQVSRRSIEKFVYHLSFNAIQSYFKKIFKMV
ncbi:MAG: hypothetical protein SGCHY_002347 [Lobulomycetales sp.]